MNVYLLRHGEAGSHFTTGDDSQRPLTPEGVEKLNRQAKSLRDWNTHFDKILSSPFTRARQTADAIARAYDLTVTEDERIASMYFTHKSLGLILKEYDTLRNLLLVGHEPDFSTVLSQTVGGGDFNFVKGGLAKIDIRRLTPATGTLIYFLTPEIMGA